MLLCQDVLIDVCRFLTRQQLANSVAPLNRCCWLSLFQPGQPFHTYPCHVVDELSVYMDCFCVDHKFYNEAFFVTTRSSGHSERSILLQLDIGDDRPSLLSDEAVTLPGHVRFKRVRVNLMALLEQKQNEPSEQQEEDHSEDSAGCGFDFPVFSYIVTYEHPLPTPLVLDRRKLELLDALSANFRGATLEFSYLLAPFSYRIALSAFLSSDEFFGRFFGKFEAINFWGSSLPINDVPIADQPLLRLPGLMRNKRQLLFECETPDYMFDVDEIVEWLHYAGDGTNKSDCAERILFINGISFRSQQLANQWWENLITELKKSLLCATKTQPYTLYIDGPMYDEVDTSESTSSAAVLETNYNTCEQLINEMHDPRQQGLPLGIEMGGIQQGRLERLFEVLRRKKMVDDP